MCAQGVTAYEADVIEVLKDLTSDWEDAFSGDVSRDTRLIDDLGFESIDVVHLITAIEQKYERRDLPFEKLLMVEGRYKDELTVAEIAEFLNEHL